ncbi:DUF177 domain-containing protein [Fusibacter paucivorans]|uniref:DUF177 domain-containing protein n=1 Tax=Fusibacter paucivorans TaxID=76009 RepID=A0ABS5PQL9_9FIRM|nr:DUF177 domain-containing protein [Fusibacter paucivorans]MBS7527460.1 DUF177 domain-containing protein [Fusibacter paucivorans]
MYLELSKVITGLQSQLDFQLRLSLDDRFLSEVNAVKASEFNIQGTVKKVDKGLTLSFAYDGNMTFACDRCLTEVKLNFNHIAERELADDEAGDDSIPIVDHQVDLMPILEEEILLNKPLQILCSDDCAGLCPKCGKNLNNGICGCEDERIDPRLEALKNLFGH